MAEIRTRDAATRSAALPARSLPHRPLDLALVADQIVRADGQGRVMRECARAAATAGHRVTLYSRRVDPALLELDGVQWHPVGDTPGPQIVRDIGFAARVGRALSRADHDAACIKGPCARPPVPTVYYASFSWDGWRRAVGPVAPAALRLHARAAGWRERRSLAGAAAVIAVSETLAADLAPALRRLSAPPPLHIIPNGVDLEEFAPPTAAEREAARARLGLDPAAFAIAFVGEFRTPRKGLEALVRAVGLGTDPRERLLVAGEGPNERLAGIAGIDRTLLLGRVVPVRPVFAAADAVCVPSLSEPFSLVALEAAACGLPVVLAAGAGAATVLDGAALLVRDPRDPRNLRRAIDRLRGDPEAARMLGARARRIAASIPWSATAARAVGVLEQVAVGEREEVRR